MKHILSITLILAVSLVAFASGRSDDDAKAVEGTWIPVRAELAGQPMPDAVLKTISMTLGDGKYAVLVGDHPDNGTYTLDSCTDPKSITVTGTEGPNQGKTFPAIYELGKDENGGGTLRICYDLSGQKRPTEFKTVAATKLYLVTYGRKKS